MTPREVALGIADEAAQIMLRWFEKGTEAIAKPDGSPVTQADIEINAMAVERIAKAFPDHGFVGEEQSGDITTAEYVWVCDPIDGTRPFSTGVPISTFTLALIHNGDPIFGVVAWPFRGWVFVAEKGKGATLNGQPIKVSAAPVQQKLIEVSSDPHSAYAIPGIFDALGKRGFVTSWSHSTALFASFIACGRLSGMVWCADSPWDIGAAKLILEEAGGVITDLYGSDQRYDQAVKGFIAADSAAMHAEILEIVTACGVVKRY